MYVHSQIFNSVVHYTWKVDAERGTFITSTEALQSFFDPPGCGPAFLQMIFLLLKIFVKCVC